MIRLSFKNPYLVLVFSIMVIVMGGVLIPQMAVDLLPQFKKSAMQILTLYPGMPAEVVEKDITSRMERWTGQSNGILKQESKSLMGVSIVTNTYREDIDPAEAMANTSSYAMSDMYYQPPGTLPPMVQPFDPTASKPLMLLTVSSEVKDGKELYGIAYYALRQMLSGVKGIIAPAAYGGSKRRIYIYVDPEKLEALGLSQTEVADAIQKNTTMIPSGIAKIGDINYGIDAQGMIKEVSEFNDIVITYKNGNPIYVKDIGEAADASVIQTNIARVDGKEQVYLPIFKRPGANTIAAVESVRAALPLLKDRMPDDVNLNVVFDQSVYVRKSISGLAYAGLGGLILVIIVLILFLGNFRSAIAVAISLPLSVLFAFLGLYATGQAINSITLGGIAMVLGLLVDNSIVVLENVDRHLKMGKEASKAAMEAALEVATPVLASTLVIMVVFIPTMFLTGMAKYLFSPLAITVGSAMIGSYIFSLTLIPLIAAYFFRNQLPNSSGSAQKLTAFQKLIEWLRRGYESSLSIALKARFIVLFLTVLLFGGAVWLMSGSGYELYPKTDVGQMEIEVRMESGTPLKASEAVIAQMESVISDELGTDLNQVISNIGVFYDLPAAYTPNSGTQDAFILVQLKEEHGIPTDDYVQVLRDRFHAEFPGVEVSFNTGGLITAALNEGKTAPIDIQVKGPKLDQLRLIAERMRDTLNTINATRDVRVLQRLDQPTKEIDLDRVKAAELGVEPVDAIKNIVSAMNSSATFQKSFWIDESNGNHYYVGVTYPEHMIDNEHTIGNVLSSSKTHDKPVPFRNFSKIRRTTAPVEINHHNLMREFNVYANVEGKDIGRTSDEIELMLENIRPTLPRGYELNFEGEVSIIKESFANLGMGLILAILLAFLIITPLFRSFRQPLIIIFTFPLGIIGIAALMWITNTNLNIQSIMGIIMMVGISVSYGNILVDRINGLVIEGQSTSDAIVNGASDRFRPLLMTASTTIFGLLPSAWASTGGGANVPLAIAVIGGTFMATLLTLYIIPILYSMISKTSKTS
ncbi:MAG: CzcA family heavy metal efflux pump [Bacteroidia bacterium]|jgi:CzcA family heavy metal efflux pump